MSPLEDFFTQRRFPGFTSEFLPDSMPKDPESYFGSFLFSNHTEVIPGTRREKILQLKTLLFEAIAARHPSFSKTLLPSAVIDRLQKHELFLHLPKDPVLFSSTLIRLLSDDLLTEKQFVTLLVVRAEALEPELETASQTLHHKYDALKPELVSFILSIPALKDCAEHEKSLLEKRLSTLQNVIVFDGLIALTESHAGDYDPLHKCIRVAFNIDRDDVLIHEMFHAVSSHLYSLAEWKPSDFILQQFAEESSDSPEQGDNSSSIRARESVRVGLRVEGRFSMLNEAVTEFLAHALYVRLQKQKDAHYQEAPNTPSSYYFEIDLFMTLLGVGQSQEPSLLQKDPSLYHAQERARRHGLFGSEESDLLSLLLRAYFFDHAESPHGRSHHWRQASQKLRHYFGDGILVALDEAWEANFSDKKRAYTVCTALLRDRFIATWTPPKPRIVQPNFQKTS